MVCLLFGFRCCWGGESPELSDKMLDRYQQASALTSEGYVASGAKGNSTRDRKTFKLSFVRPDQFDLDIVGVVPNTTLPQTNRVFMLEGKAYSQLWPAVQPHQETSLYEALRTVRGASAGVSMFVPCMLLGTNVFVRGAAKQQPNVVVHGISCLHFSAPTVWAETVEVFIDPKSLEILKLQRTVKLNAAQLPARTTDKLLLLRTLGSDEIENAISFHNTKFD
jgi:hypothetical protein